MPPAVLTCQQPLSDIHSSNPVNVQDDSLPMYGSFPLSRSSLHFYLISLFINQLTLTGTPIIVLSAMLSCPFTIFFQRFNVKPIVNHSWG